MKVINDLLNYNNFKIVQDDRYFNFSLDSVLLPNFVTLNKNISKILDLGTGNAPIPMILTTKTKAKIFGIELQKELFDMAKESIQINELEERITLINDNMKNIKKHFSPNTFDVILCNPPFFKYTENSNINKVEQKLIARHEKEIKLEEIVQIAKTYLKNNGIIAIVHRTERFVEIVELFKKYSIEPKRIQLIYTTKDKDSKMFLIEGRKNAHTGLKILKPLVIHEDNGEYREEIKRMFS